ncbi:adenylate/guanylate cyclase domain-containing protein [Rhizobium sp. TRM95796]|uniref:adenylate/guanylate cyclase domain-containing protein n=1 Tax=Rhizobium sp. TRM95796 TaxID=2979862 RepID=UPI0021E89996|nr:adenylate/guanylate cyclase domain-containing protein [Rhizobium sp. TRM95796]MCV3767667.1 adenylate/guanylate cyclase domain-containing protein [Rhizobium sp. TRM95796]
MTIRHFINRSRLHIASGVTLAVFLVTHFLNHALGLHSLALMEWGRGYFSLIWRSPPGTALLYGALLTHAALALEQLARRRSWRMPLREAMKIAFGLSIPYLLIQHVTGTRLEYVLSGYDRGYLEVLRALWSGPGSKIQYVTALIVIWGHACLGLWFWLRGKAWFNRVAGGLGALALLLLFIAMTGFVTGALEARGVQIPKPPVTPLPLDLLYGIQDWLYAGWTLLIAAAGSIGFIVRGEKIRIRYAGGKIVIVPKGSSVLEASRSGGVPHVSVCGGKGRCSTCRVQVLEGGQDQPAPEAREIATLRSIGAGADVRLACQLRPVHDLTVLPLLDASGMQRSPRRSDEGAAGREQLVAALFCDLRGFTQLSENKLPYDVVYLLNRYFAMVDNAVTEAGGVVDKFVGDGAIALFGLEGGFDVGCRQALTAAARLSEELGRLNTSLAGELDRPLRVAMGLHGGPAIVGTMGSGRAAGLTAIGDTINTASRLEGLAKQRNVELAVSADLVRAAGADCADLQSEHLEIRGKSNLLETWLVPDAATVRRLLPSAH